MQPPPFPIRATSLTNCARSRDPDQQLITDMFERIVLYDVSPTSPTVTAVDGEYELASRSSGASSKPTHQGVEHEVPLDTAFDLVVFPEATCRTRDANAALSDKHRLQSGTQRMSSACRRSRAAVGVDPFHLMIDHAPDNNLFLLTSP